jgi:hypothetical protein
VVIAGAAHADAARHERALRVVGDGVLVDGEADLFEQGLGVLAGDPAGRRSTSMRWLSVPPETRRRPHSTIAAPIALALMTTWSM